MPIITSHAHINAVGALGYLIRFASHSVRFAIERFLWALQDDSFSVILSVVIDTWYTTFVIRLDCIYTPSLLRFWLFLHLLVALRAECADPTMAWSFTSWGLKARQTVDKVSKRPASLHPRVRKGREIGNPPRFSQCRKESICRKTCCFKYLLPFLSSPIAKHTETIRQTINGLQITLEPLGSQRLLFTLADYQHLEG